MKKQIRGLSPATITFNNNDLTLRGTEEAGVEILNSAQENEINELVIAGLIEVIGILEDETVTEESFAEELMIEDTPQPNANEVGLRKEVEVLSAENVELRTVNSQLKAQIISLIAAKEALEEEQASSILDSSAAAAIAVFDGSSTTEDASECHTVNVDCGVVQDAEPVKKGRGRPKGSKNKPKVEEPKVEEPKVEEPKVKEPKIEEPKIEEPKVEVEVPVSEKSGSTVVVGTSEGIVEGQMKNSFVPQGEDSEAVQESLDAMAKLEAEERGEIEEGEEEPLVIDESTLDPSEQMGRAAIISTGDAPIEVPMKASILPENEAISERDPFIENDHGEKPSPHEEKHGPEFLEADSADILGDALDEDNDEFDPAFIEH